VKRLSCWLLLGAEAFFGRLNCNCLFNLYLVNDETELEFAREQKTLGLN
jgi:hypothetical protein